MAKPKDQRGFTPTATIAVPIVRTADTCELTECFTIDTGAASMVVPVPNPAQSITCDPCTQLIIDALVRLQSCSCPKERPVSDSGELKALKPGTTAASLAIPNGTRDLIIRNATDSDCRITLPTGFVYLLAQETLILRNPYDEDALQPFSGFSARITFSGSVGNNARIAANYRIF